MQLDKARDGQSCGAEKAGTASATSTAVLSYTDRNIYDPSRPDTFDDLKTFSALGRMVNA